ncbi:MAG: hypothetical protein HZA54_17240, partial [Planctomycetes bacterium]|nr:hypothetical protein [Planctomycetota bacterium]
QKRGAAGAGSAPGGAPEGGPQPPPAAGPAKGKGGSPDENIIDADFETK